MALAVIGTGDINLIINESVVESVQYSRRKCIQQNIADFPITEHNEIRNVKRSKKFEVFIEYRFNSVSCYRLTKSKLTITRYGWHVGCIKTTSKIIREPQPISNRRSTWGFTGPFHDWASQGRLIGNGSY